MSNTVTIKTTKSLQWKSIQTSNVWYHSNNVNIVYRFFLKALHVTSHIHEKATQSPEPSVYKRPRLWNSSAIPPSVLTDVDEYFVVSWKRCLLLELIGNGKRVLQIDLTSYWNILQTLSSFKGFVEGNKFYFW